MKQKYQVVLAILITVFVLVNPLMGKGKRGLLIIAHGSPRAEWNQPVLSLESQVIELLQKNGNSPFLSVRVALMEFNEPTIYTVVNEMEKSGVEEIYALPLFIAPSEHSLVDIPTILGLYNDKRMVNKLKEEGIKIVDSKIKITLGPSLHYGDILKLIMLDRVKELSESSANENLIILAHGATNYKKNWENICTEVGGYICGMTGIRYFDFAFIEVGQSFIQEGIPAILKATENGNKTLVIGLYLSLNVDNLQNRFSFSMGNRKINGAELLKGKNIVFAKKGILPDSRIPQWIVTRALEWVN